MTTRTASGPRVYNLFPTLLGPVETWQARLSSIADMGFDWVFLNPFHYPGFSGSLYAVKDHYRLHPVVQGDSDEPADARLRRFTRAAADLGISVMLDLVVNHTARDCPLVERHPDWYRHDAQGAVRSPRAVDPDDPDTVTVWGDLAELDYRERPARAAMLSYWDGLVAHYVGLGFRGFRCDAAYQLPGDVWEELIGSARAANPQVTFFAETLGARLDEVDQLRPAGFDFFFNSAKWWDFRADWLLDQYEQFRHVAPSIAFPESHDTGRVAAESGGSAAESRFRYLFAAFFSTGVMLPIGYEYGFRRPLHVVETRPGDWEEPAFDITDYVAAVNRTKAAIPALNREGPQTRFTDPGSAVVGLLRRDDAGGEPVAALINPDPDRDHAFDAGELARVLDADAAALREMTPAREDGFNGADGPDLVTLGPRSLRLFVPGR